MVRTMQALYDGVVLRLEAPLPLEPNTRVRITIETLEDGGEDASFLDTARSLNLTGPPDWAEDLDSYLYHGESGRDG